MNQNTSIIAALILLVLIGTGIYFYANRGPATPASGTGDSVDVTSLTDATASSVCTGQSGHARILCLADTLKSSVSADILAELQLPYTLADAKKWSNFPQMGYRNRVGPTMSELSAGQVALVKQMVKEAAGTAGHEGYDEVQEIMNADDYLNAQTGETGFSSGNYHIAFLGTPSATGTWELQFGGHHLAFANTYKDGVLIGATPSFRGVEPFNSFTQNGRDNLPMNQETAAFSVMLTSMSAAELAKAKLAQIFGDVVVGPQKDDAFPATPAGVRVGDLSSDKQALVVKAIETYVNDIDTADAAALMQKYKNELAETYVSYAGTTGVNAVNDYVRIDGPSVWIELSMQRGASLDGAHPHSVWRDKATDYGGTK